MSRERGRSGERRRGIALSGCAAVALCLFVAMSARGADDYLDACGVWQHYGGTPVTPTECPAVKGRLMVAKWAEIETANDVWDWTAIDTDLDTCHSYGYKVGIMIHTGTAAPSWLYSAGVPEVVTDRGGPYPYYFDDDYKAYFKRMIQKVYQHIMAYPADKRNRIVFIQAAFGPTGDVGPWKGTPKDGYVQYEISKDEWVAYEEEMASEYYSYYGQTDPRIFVMYNQGNDPGLSPGFEKHLLANCPGWWSKCGHENQGYQLNDDVKRNAWKMPIIHSKQVGFVTRCRAEQSETSTGWWNVSPQWNEWQTQLYGLWFGLDFAMFHGDTLQDASLLPIFQFRNRYAGRKWAQISPGAFAGLRDGLDASDVVRFPEATYGAASQDNRQRYLDIAAAFSAYGAGEDDVASAIGGPMTNRNATGLNDVQWNIYTGNYCRYLDQFDPNGTSIGRWRVGPSSERYGRFARSFQNSTGRNTMYFNIDDTLLGGVPVNGAYPVTVKVVYHDQGSGTWELRYDSTAGDKRAVLVTKTNTDTWKESVSTLSDAYFGNRCAHATDFYLNNTDTNDDVFSFIEVLKPDAATHSEAPWFLANPITKKAAVQNIDYWTHAHQQVDLDAIDINCETLTFSKIAGPAWLTVSTDGELGGTPGAGDVGLNQFTVRVTDASGLYAEAAMSISVLSNLLPAAPTGLVGTPDSQQAGSD